MIRLGLRKENGGDEVLMHLEPRDDGPKGLEIRQIETGEKAPYDLLLLADPSKEVVDRYLQTSYIYVGQIQDALVGAFVLTPVDADKVEIKNIAVLEGRQGQGIGSLLLQNAVIVAKQRGFKSICIGTANASIGQLYLYQKQGFEISEIKKNFFIENYRESIFENGIQCKHMIMLEKSLLL